MTRIQAELDGFLDTWPFSTRPWLRFTSFNDLPYLWHWMVVALWLGPTFPLSIFVIDRWQTFRGLDPLVRDECIPVCMAVSFMLLFFSGLMVFKQLSYYYEGEGKKDGLIKKKLRQANNKERTLDLLSAIVTPFMVVSCLIPTWWFLMVAVFSFLVVWRCHTTLKRPEYIKRFEKEKGLRVSCRFLSASLQEEFNPGKYGNRREESLIKHILSSWVINHSIYFLLSLWLFLFFNSDLFSSFSLETKRCYFFLLTFVLVYIYTPNLPGIPQSWGVRHYDRVFRLPIPPILFLVALVLVPVWWCLWFWLRN